MNYEINETAFKYDEIKLHFEDYIEDIKDDDIENTEDFLDDLHHNAFNTDFYIIGNYQAKKWCEDEVFNIIDIIKEYEEDHFGEVTTDFSSPERVVNMYAYIVGEYIVYKWKEKFELVEAIQNFLKSIFEKSTIDQDQKFIKDHFQIISY